MIIKSFSFSLRVSLARECLTMVSLINRLLILACAFQVGSVTTKYIGCLDENGQPTDWFYLYKLPKRVAASGLNYLYLTGTSNGWRLANVTIDDRQSIPGAMISGLTVNDLIIMYNDEPPGEKSDEDRGHTKGVLAANDNSGFWLVHSVPKYPDSDYADYKYPPTGHLYGQSFLCISLKEHQIDLVGQQLKYNEPHVYLGQIPQSLETKYPSLAEVAKSKVLIKDPPFFSLENITGTDFMSFAKSSKFGKELYVDWVAPTLHSHLNVESWLHGSGRIDSECDKPFK